MPPKLSIEMIAWNMLDFTTEYRGKLDMAKPRIFISSTYFDLRTVRADMERFVRELGFEPVLFERGSVPYGKDKALEDYCYREINSCDILVAIIGGKYGTASKDGINSITQKELRTAIDLGKQIYVFVERSVHGEFRTFQANKDVKGFKPASVDDVKVFKFLEEVYGLPVGNPVEPFEFSEDITRFLKEQFAGLFQRLLQESSRQKEINLIDELGATAATLKQLVTFLSESKAQGDGAIKEILLSNHPAFAAIKRLVSIQYRVVFHNLRELDQLLSARGYKKDPEPRDDDYLEWDHRPEQGLRILASIFDDDGNLKIFTPEKWKDDWIETYTYEKAPEENGDDEIPF